MRKAITFLACIGWLLSTMTPGFGRQTKTSQPSQPHPDLSGKWILDLGKSRLGRDRTQAKITSVTLVISHQEPVLTFTETTDYQGHEVTEQTTCYTDGRDGTNRRYADKQDRIARSIGTIAVKSNTQWKGKALVTTSTTERTIPSYEVRAGRDSSYGATGPVTPDSHFSVNVPVLRIERYGTTIKRELSSDGQTFTITIRGQGPKIVKVFERAAGPHPDLSGKWILDLGKSKLNRERAPLKIRSVSLLISHDEPVLKLTETTDYEGLQITEETTCYTDGRGETNLTPIRSMAMKSKTRWNGTQLRTKSSINSTRPSSEVRNGRDNSFGAPVNTAYYVSVPVLSTQHFSTTVKRELSADGQTLTVTICTQGPDVVKAFRRAQ